MLLPDNTDDLESAYEMIEKIIDSGKVKEMLLYNIAQIQNSALDVEYPKDYIKGYLVCSFGHLVQKKHRMNANHPFDNGIQYETYVNKIVSSPKLKKLMDEII